MLNRKTFLALLLSVTLAIAGVAFAAGVEGNPEHGKAAVTATGEQRHATCCAKYVDANKDGVCDNTGACDKMGCSKRCCAGKQFVDANNDGICDNCPQATCPMRKQAKTDAPTAKTADTNAQTGRGFVDANNDGVCDRACAGGQQCAGRGQCATQSRAKGKGLGSDCNTGPVCKGRASQTAGAAQ